MIRAILLFSIITISLPTGAQTAFEALRYSNYNIESTARNMGVGGAMSGLGADFVSLITNPAGLGGYRFTEWTFTPGVFRVGARADFENSNPPNTEKEGKAQFLFSEVGFVKVRTPQEGVWYTSNFGIGYNQLQNFNQEFFFSGESQGSIVDRFLDQVRAEGFNDFESGLAADADAIYDNGGVTVSDIELNPDAFIYKEQLVNRTGSQGELAVGFGGNYRERMLIGFSIGIPIISYSETKSYQERDNQSQVPFFEALTFTENLRTTGIGINAKLGVLFMPAYNIRLGGAIHTPTRYSMMDNFDTAFSYIYTPANSDVSTTNLARSPEGAFEYRFRSPWRFLANAGYVIGEYGFLTAELEYLNYGNGQFSPTATESNFGTETFLNTITADVAALFRRALNMRVGGEIAWNNLRLRAGVGLGTSPYVNGRKVNAKIGTGVGFRRDRFFFDFGYRIARFQETYAPFLLNSDLEPSIQTAFTDQRFILTIGIKQG
ncbi:MAG: hypothetical protein AAF738_00420 [Bacteroidota bacterium]